MIPSAFDYTAPESLDDALRALADAGDDAKIIAGGQSLMPVLRLRMNDPAMVVDLGRIAELRGVRDDGDAVAIGAMTTHHDVLHDPLVRDHARLLAEAAGTVADAQIRHRGTLGGALAHADPAGDLLAPALALDATMTIAGLQGRREVSAAEFFEDLFTTAVGPDEILVEIRVPKHTGWTGHYEKFNRTAQAWAIVAVAAALKVADGRIAEARVALTNMASVPVRARGVEEALVGRPADAATIRDAAARAGEGTSPTSDGNADGEYRTHLAQILTARAVTAAAGT
ncbi:FAD binding domain-containing protein [Tomitella cavernea]|uniref:Xanthine dehydrogenase family protein subunit M n=1 Tax=Tomitella cavernea TaxID=1387982 RepID=A0ABP9CQ79_9ACTN|nr:xanthine dehydrogenase family protein subunit M [Tomitella cavernea]